jgi:trimethylamine-N-oxide reductase cytochrome c-type subunit TorC
VDQPADHAWRKGATAWQEPRKLALVDFKKGGGERGRHLMSKLSKAFPAALLIAALSCGFTQPGVCAESLFSRTTKTMFIAMPAGQPQGVGDARLLPLSKVEVLERQGDWVKVKLEGWQQDGAERALYALRGRRILVAALGNDAVTKVEKLTTETDADTGLVWHRATVTLWTARDGLEADRAKLMAQGAELHTKACGGCHAGQSPASHLANQWTGLLKGMRDRTTLDDEQYRFLEKYLQLSAKDAGGPS